MKFFYTLITFIFFTFTLAIPVSDPTYQEALREIRDSNAFNIELSDLSDLLNTIDLSSKRDLEKRENVALTQVMTVLNQTGQGVAILKALCTNPVTQPTVLQSIGRYLKTEDLGTLFSALDNSNLAVDVVISFFTNPGMIPGLIKIGSSVWNKRALKKRGFFSDIANGIGNLVSGLVNTAGNVVGTVQNATSTVVSGVGNGIGTTLSGNPAGGISQIGGALGNATAQVGGALNGAVSGTLGGVFGLLGGVFNSAQTALINSLVSLIQSTTNVEEICVSLDKSGLGVSVVKSFVTDTQMQAFTVTLVNKVIKDQDVTISRAVAGLQSSDLVGHTVSKIWNNTSYRKIVFNYFLGLLIGLRNKFF